MYIMAFLLILCGVTYVNNQKQGIDDSNVNAYSFDNKSSYIILASAIIGFFLESIMKKPQMMDNYYIVLLIYSGLTVMALVTANALRIKNIEQERDQIYQMYEILESLLNVKKDKVDFNDVPFKIEYDKHKKDKPCKVVVRIDNQKKFEDAAITQASYTLKKYLPYKNWTGQADFPERVCVFTGADLPPSMAHFPGSDFRPPTVIPLGIGGNSNNEIVWNIGASKKEIGESQYIMETGDIEEGEAIDLPELIKEKYQDFKYFVVNGVEKEKEGSVDLGNGKKGTTIKTAWAEKSAQALVVGVTGGGKSIECNEIVEIMSRDSLQEEIK